MIVSTNKALRNLYCISRAAKEFRDINALCTLYNAYVKSILNFASPVWSPYYDIESGRIERVQRKFLRLLSFR